MVEISIGGGSKFKCAEADIVKSFIVNAVRLICVLYQLVHRECGVVGLHHGVRHFGRRHHAEGVHYTIRVLLANLADEQGAHARASAATQGVSELEAEMRRYEVAHSGMLQDVTNKDERIMV